MSYLLWGFGCVLLLYSISLSVLRKWDITCTNTSGIIFFHVFHSFGCSFASSNTCTEMKRKQLAIL